MPSDELEPRAYVDWCLDQQLLGSERELVESRSGASAQRARTFHRFGHRYEGYPVYGDGSRILVG